LHRLYSAYIELGDEGLGDFLKLYRLMKEKGMSIEQVVNAVYAAIHKLSYMESLYGQAKDQAENMQRTTQRLANDVATLERKSLLLDKIVFSSEQDCKRKEQQIQKLTAEKDRLESLIAYILNNDNEGYSKLKHIIKENVKAALSENRKLISISFVVLIQTLKDDPEMIKLIQNMPSANDGEQHKDNNNNNNITKYLESNKDSILGLAEKNYEKLVEALTNNAISSADSSSSPIPY
jgi:hypothetical protein